MRIAVSIVLLVFACATYAEEQDAEIEEFLSQTPHQHCKGHHKKFPGKFGNVRECKEHVLAEQQRIRDEKRENEERFQRGLMNLMILNAARTQPEPTIPSFNFWPKTINCDSRNIAGSIHTTCY